MFAPGDFQPPSGHRIGAAYIRTACGRTIAGDSPARKQFGKMLAAVIGKWSLHRSFGNPYASEEGRLAEK